MTTSDTRPTFSGLGPHTKHSRRYPCPVCDGTTSYCISFADGGTLCGRVESDRPAGLGWMHWPNGRPDDWRERLAALPKPAPRPQVDPDLADRAYRALLNRCPLSAAHRAALHRRNLSDAQIARHGYVTSPATQAARQALAAAGATELGQELVGQVPGFMRDKRGRLDLVCRDGEMLIPVHDVLGRIVGLRRRKDHPGNGPKYLWFSAGFDEGTIGVDGHTCHVGRPEVLRSHIVVIVDGEIDANLSADHFGCVVISVPGMGNTSRVLETLAALDATDVVFALDKDIDRATVDRGAAQEARLARLVSDAGYRVGQWSWDAEDAKGLDDLATAGLAPFPIPHPALAEPATPCPDVAALRRELAAAKAYASDLVQTFLNPALGHKEKMALVAYASLTVAKAEAGEVEPDGRVVLNTYDISDDHRPKAEPGERIAPVNPRTGTTPRLTRSTVKPMMEKFIASGLLPGEVRPVTRTRANGSPYPDWEFVIDPGSSLTALLSPWAQYRPETPKTRKVREAKAAPEPHACPHCQEVHPLSYSCTGCGAILGETLELPTMGENISPIENPLPSPSLVRNGRKHISDRSDPIPFAVERRDQRPDRDERHALAAQDLEKRATAGAPLEGLEEPAWVQDALAPTSDDLSQADIGLDAPPLYEAQEILVTATFAHPDTTKRALQDVEAQLARIAVQRGGTPVPKPSARTFTPPDPWAEYAPGAE